MLPGTGEKIVQAPVLQSAKLLKHIRDRSFGTVLHQKEDVLCILLVLDALVLDDVLHESCHHRPHISHRKKRKHTWCLNSLSVFISCCRAMIDLAFGARDRPTSFTAMISPVSSSMASYTRPNVPWPSSFGGFPVCHRTVSSGKPMKSETSV